MAFLALAVIPLALALALVQVIRLLMTPWDESVGRSFAGCEAHTGRHRQSNPEASSIRRAGYRRFHRLPLPYEARLLRLLPQYQLSTDHSGVMLLEVCVMLACAHGGSCHVPAWT